MNFYDKLKFNADGLIPAIVQEQGTGRVLMLAWMNRASLESTIATGRTHFWSRSRQKFWMKGETSGHVQVVKDIAFDCDGDTLLIQVEQNGPDQQRVAVAIERDVFHGLGVAAFLALHPVFLARAAPEVRLAGLDGVFQ